MDKLRVTNHIQDDDLKIKMYKIVDICNNVIKNHEIKHSEFLNPFELRNAISIVNSDSDLNYSVEGGIEECERAILNVFPYYISNDDIDTSIAALRVDGNFKFSSVSHRDYLGSILGLGIKREKIGDIFVHEDYCQLVVDKDISDFIIFNLKKVGHNSIKVKEISISELSPPQIEYENINTTVSSLRLDNIISSIFNISRSKVGNYIEAGLVTVDYEKIERPSFQVKEGSLISVRKKGRFILLEIENVTRKEKIRIKVSKYK